jgi:hypothetical protein
MRSLRAFEGSHHPTVAVLLNVYANCIDGPEGTANERIAAALEAGRVSSGTLVTSVTRASAESRQAAGQPRDNGLGEAS